MQAVVLSGLVKYFEKRADSGNTIKRGFCPDCGSQLFATHEQFLDVLAIRAGTLDDPANFRPEFDFYVSSALPWDHMDPDLPKFPHLPPRRTHLTDAPKPQPSR